MSFSFSAKYQIWDILDFLNSQTALNDTRFEEKSNKLLEIIERVNERQKKVAFPTKIPNHVLLPVAEEGGYVWKGLEVKTSLVGKGNAGLGLFANVNFPFGTSIPIWGIPLRHRDTNTLNFSNSHVYGTSTKGLIDGNPQRAPFKNVGMRGLAISMMVNEPEGRKNPNCIFKRDMLVMIRPIKKGQELYVYYGPEYTRVGYSVSDREQVTNVRVRGDLKKKMLSLSVRRKLIHFAMESFFSLQSEMTLKVATYTTRSRAADTIGLGDMDFVAVQGLSPTLQNQIYKAVEVGEVLRSGDVSLGWKDCYVALQTASFSRNSNLSAVAAYFPDADDLLLVSVQASWDEEGAVQKFAKFQKDVSRAMGGLHRFQRVIVCGKLPKGKSNLHRITKLWEADVRVYSSKGKHFVIADTHTQAIWNKIKHVSIVSS